MKSELRSVPVKGVYLWSSGLAEENRRVVRRQARPTSPIDRWLFEISQAGHLLHLMVLDSHPEYDGCRRVFGPDKEEHIVSVARPFRIGGMHLRQLSPLLGVDIE